MDTCIKNLNYDEGKNSKNRYKTHNFKYKD